MGGTQNTSDHKLTSFNIIYFFLDSIESAAREISVFFPDFDTSQWILDNEENFHENTPKMIQSIKEMTINNTKVES